MEALAELLGLVALMIVSAALLCWGIDGWFGPIPRPRVASQPRRKRKGKK